MKKIILICLIFLCTSCYDYKEINNLAFVNTIGIDYDDCYHIYFEILNDTNENNDNTYMVSANGNTINEAFNNITLKINKYPYYAHLKAIIIDKNNALYNFKEISDYIIRNPEISNQFYLLISSEQKTKDIIKLKQNNNINIGNSLNDIIKNNTYSYNNSYNKFFSDMIYRMNNNNLELLTTQISINNDNLLVDGISYFKNYNYQGVLSNEESVILNILLKNKGNLILKKNNISIKLYDNSIKYKIYKNKIVINIKSNAEIKENNSNINFLNKNNYIKLNKIFNEEYNKKLNKFIKNNYNLLNIQDMYYKKYHKNFSSISIYVNSKININKKGMIFNINEK